MFKTSGTVLSSVKSGFLKKPGHYVHRWKMRWYVLTKDALIRYDRNPTPGAHSLLYKQISALPLSDILSVEFDPEFVYKKKKHCFQLITLKCVHIIRASNDIECKEWVDAIRGLITRSSKASKTSDQNMFIMKTSVSSTLKSYKLNVPILLKDMLDEDWVSVNLHSRGLFHIPVPDNKSMKYFTLYYDSTTEVLGTLKVKWERVEGRHAVSEMWMTRLFIPSITFLLFYFHVHSYLQEDTPVVLKGCLWVLLVVLVMQIISWQTKPTSNRDWNLTVVGWMPPSDNILNDGSDVSDSSIITGGNSKRDKDQLKDFPLVSLLSPSTPAAGSLKFGAEDVKMRFDKAVDRGRYLKSEFSVESCMKRWSASQSWRDKEGVADILKRPYPNFSCIRKNYPSYIMGRTKEGHRVFAEKPSAINFTALAHAGITMDDLLYHYIFVNEFLWNQVETSEEGKVFYIIDMDGMNIQDAMASDALEFLKMASKLVQDHYPERCSKICILNTPTWFTSFSSVTFQFFNDVTKSKFEICAPKSQLKVLSKYLDIENIPEAWGGKAAKGSVYEWDSKLDRFVGNLNGKEEK